MIALTLEKFPLMVVTNKKDHRVCDGLSLTSFDMLQLSLLLLQLLIFPVQIHWDADHDTQADDDKDAGQNHFTHDAHSCSVYSNFFPHFGQYSKSSVVV